MRLLNVNSFQLESFDDEGRPPYAILSHTWGKDEEEVSFRDMQERVSEKICTDKLMGACKATQSAGLQYVWIDTCCIDKTSSVELGEAINSMFRWYKESETCFAYLADVTDKKVSSLAASRWFTRGWTLQELLAPRRVLFHNASWRPIGLRSELSSALEKITGIGRPYLLGMAEVQEASVAQRMSWAAKRNTKRKEDIAYCLLGIFHISMPMIYGEGDKAFLRLQQEILKTTRDDSILAWGFLPPGTKTPPFNSLYYGNGPGLAAAPSDFTYSGHIIPLEESVSTPVEPIEIVGGRLRVRLRITEQGDSAICILNCRNELLPKLVVAIHLRRDEASPEGATAHYMRLEGRAPYLRQPDREASLEVFYIRHESEPVPSDRRYWFYIKHLHPELKVVEVEPPHRWKECNSLISTVPSLGGKGMQDTFLRVRREGVRLCDFVVVLSFDTKEKAASSHVFSVPRGAELKQVAAGFGYFRADIVRKSSAVNGSDYIEVAVWEEVVARQPMFAVALLTDDVKLPSVKQESDQPE